MSLAEILLILVVVLLVMGPERLPELARTLGKGMREIQRASNMFRDTFMLEEQRPGRQRPDQMMPTTDSGPADTHAEEPRHDLSAHAAHLEDFEAARIIRMDSPAKTGGGTLNVTELETPEPLPAESRMRQIELDPPILPSVW